MSAESRRLVFGDDGSRGADVAWLWINNHAWPRWRISVFTGARPPYPPSSWGSTARAAPWTPPWGRKYRDPSSLTELTFVHAETDPRLLLDEQFDADLIVVGHADRSLLRSMWTGSTTEWLLHHPGAPLMIVRSASVVQHVVCCIDGSSSSFRALDVLLALPLAAEVDLTIVTVDDGRVDVGRASASARAILKKAGIVAKIERVGGDPSHAILEHLSVHQPQLVVLGTKGLTGWSRLRLGSTAATVVHHAACTSLVACAEPEHGPAAEFVHDAGQPESRSRSVRRLEREEWRLHHRGRAARGRHDADAGSADGAR